MYEISEIDRDFLTNDSGLKIINTVSTLTKDRFIPILIVKCTNKFIKNQRHGLLARISGIQQSTNLKLLIQLFKAKTKIIN